MVDYMYLVGQHGGYQTILYNKFKSSVSVPCRMQVLKGVEDIIVQPWGKFQALVGFPAPADRSHTCSSSK